MKRFYLFKKAIICFLLVVLLNFSFNYASANVTTLYLGGNVLGFTIKTEGATVVGTCDVITENGLVSPLKSVGVLQGDVIIKMNGNAVNSASDVNAETIKSKGNVIVLEYLRDGKTHIVNVTPAKDVNGLYRLGVFIRNDLTGLGTVTYYTSDGSFASLGHPVINENGSIISVNSGSVYSATVIGVNKASRGKAGELRGTFLQDATIGKISKNSKVGLYGKIEKFNRFGYRLIECGVATQGKAQIYSTVNGSTPEYYDVDIVKTDHKNGQNKNLVIHVCDEELIKITGGILQGMSGSPIIQNGKLVGAVTHVFLNDSTRGYGISILNMLAE